MKSIIRWVQSAILLIVPALDLAPLPDKPRGKLRLSPAQLLAVIHGPELATWALQVSHRIWKPQLPRGPGGRPQVYSDATILLIALVQTAWRRSYEQVVDWVATDEGLALALGFTRRSDTGRVRTISQGQYWERRRALGLLPVLFFFLALVGQLIRLGAITGQELIVDSSLLSAWRTADPDAVWQKYAGRKAVFGYKVHTLLCRTADLPVLALVTPANVHDSQVGWLLLLVGAWLFSFRVLVVYADAAYADRRFFWVIQHLGAYPAVDYNLRRAGKRKLATREFIRQWKRLVTWPRSDIERHFAWMKRYFGLKYFQCFTYLRVSQFVLLTYLAALAVAVAACRYERPELVRRRAMVLANV